MAIVTVCILESQETGQRALQMRIMATNESIATEVLLDVPSAEAAAQLLLAKVAEARTTITLASKLPAGLAP